MSNDSFMRKGWDAGEEAMKEAEERQEANRKGRVYRFWMPKGTETKIIFLDGELTLLWEHQVYKNGSWKNWYTCVQGMDGRTCPLCEKGDYSAANVAVFTIIDRSEWTSKKGVTHKDEMKLYVCKMEVLEQLNIQRGRRDGLVGCEFIVNRTKDDKSPNVGNAFDHVNKWTPEELLESFPDLVDEETKKIRVVDYGAHFAPKSDDELRRVAGLSSSGGGGGGGQQVQPQGQSEFQEYEYEDDIPF